MKYETEISEILKMAISKESWMTSDEHKEAIDETFRQTGITKQQISDEIKTGIKNGYTVEQQIDLLKRALK